MTAVQERMRRAHLQSRERAWGHLGRSLGPHIASIAVADSDEVLSQREVLERLGLAGDEFAEGIFARCGVQRRHLHLPPEFLALTLQGRTEQVEHQLLDRAVRAVEQLEVDPGSIGTVLSSSLYSLGCPTIAQRLVEHFGMDPATDRYHLTGVGCASAVPLMRLAAQSPPAQERARCRCGEHELDPDAGGRGGHAGQDGRVGDLR
jgi:predicted naringenin-chalcone synthase